MRPKHLLLSAAMTGLILGTTWAAAAQAPAATPPTLATAVSTPGAVEIRGVTIKDGANGETFVDIATTGAAPYRAFTLDNPDRLVLDFEGAERVSHAPLYPAHSPLLTDVRVGQFRAKDPAVVRVVADLSGNPTYDIQRVATGVRIALKSRTPASRPSQGPEAPATLSLTASQKIDNALPGNSTAVAAAPKPEVIIDSPETAEAVEAAKVIAGSTPSAAASQGEEPAGAAAAAGPKYTGEPISLNLKDVDLKDFFRLIHEISGLNIIIDPNVKGTVTMVLDNVPWDQALDIVLKNNQLGKTLEGNVLRIAKLDTLSAEQEQATKLAEAQQEAQPLVTKFVPVNYAKASAIATMLKSWVGGGALSKRGNILVDDRTNTLIVSDIASQIPIILPIIEKLDTKTKQVAIEARIERVTSDFQRNLANALSVSGINQSGSVTQSALTGPNSQQTVAPVATYTKVPPIPNSSTVTSGFGVYAVSNIGARYLLNEALSVAENTDNAKTISKPTIVTQNNVAGSVVQGVQIPIQTTINNTISIQYIQASLQLTVTPQVTSDGNIFLVINVTNSSPGAVLTGAGPSINTQSATTQVLVPDGGTVVFGGVTVNQTAKSETYVPLLGKIPVLGNLFKASVKSRSDQELLFFVSPKILPG
jgi:type IV pilus assembly protein PilQ